VTTVAVDSVVKRPCEVSYVLRIASERASGGYHQRYLIEERQYALTNQGLWVRVVTRASPYFGDRGGSTADPQKVEIIEGVLKRVD
jgi:hypothetical protein